MRSGTGAHGLIAAISIGVMLLVGSGTALLLGNPAQVRAARLAQEPAPVESPCLAVGSSAAEPKSLLLGEAVSVTLTVDILCPSEPRRRHIVLVLDGSRGMSAERGSALARGQEFAARQLIRDLDLESHPLDRVGVVSFGGRARVHCELTNLADRIDRCISSVSARGAPVIDEAVELGRQMLYAGRTGILEPGRIVENLIVTASLPNADGCPPLELVADESKDMGMQLITVCMGDRCEPRCLQSAATAPRYFYEASEPTLLMTAFGAIGFDLELSFISPPPPPPARLTVIDSIPENMRYVVGSGVPPPSDTGTGYDVITWGPDVAPRAGVTFSLEIEPLEVGCYQTNAGAYGSFVDGYGRVGEVLFPRELRVCVFEPIPIETPVGSPMEPKPDPTPVELLIRVFLPSTSSE